MSVAVWLGAERKCFATVVGLDVLLGLSTQIFFFTIYKHVPNVNSHCT